MSITKAVRVSQKGKSNSKKERKPLNPEAIMKQVNRRGNLKLYNRYINEAAKRRDSCFAQRLFHCINENQLKPDIFTFSGLINASARNMDLDQMLNDWNRMKEYGIEPNEVLFTIMMKGYVNALDIGKAMNLMEEMTNKGIQPNVRTFNTVLRGCIRLGDIKWSKRVILKMKEYGVEANKKTLEFEVRLLVYSLDMEKAWKKWKKWQKWDNGQNESKEDHDDPRVHLMLASICVMGGMKMSIINRLLNAFDNSSIDHDQQSKSGHISSPLSFDYLERQLLQSFMSHKHSKNNQPVPFPCVSTLVHQLENIHQSSLLHNPNALFHQSHHKNHCFKLEIGCGDGDWIFDQSQSEPNTQWIAMDIRFDRIHDLWRKMILGHVDNIHLILGDARNVLSYIPPNSIHSIYIHFPEPSSILNPGEFQAAQLIDRKFLKNMTKILVVHGEIFILTDDSDYHHTLISFIEQLKKYFTYSTNTQIDHHEQSRSSFFDSMLNMRSRHARYHLHLTLIHKNNT